MRTHTEATKAGVHGVIGLAVVLLLVASGCDAWRDPLGPEEASSSVSQAPSFTRIGRRSVALCHRTGGERRYILLTVADRAVPAHLRHGDALVGDPVVGQAGMVFDEACVAVPASPTLLVPERGAILDNGCSGDRGEGIEWAFDWSDVQGATRYHLFVMGATATIPLIDDASLGSSEYHYEGSGYVIEANRLGWTWKVRALVGGEWGPWSEERTFDVEPLNTDCPSALLATIEWPFTEALERDALPSEAVIETFYNGFYNDPPCTNAETRLSDVVLPWNTPGAIHTYHAGNDPRFAGFVQCLVDGSNEHLGLGLDGVSAWAVEESIALDTGTPDLAGHTISFIRLVVDELSAVPTQGGFTVHIVMRWKFYGA